MNGKKRALVIQGGGFRTAFTAGVLDAFLISSYNPFQFYIGVSGGSIALSYYLSSQYRFCFEAIELMATDPRFVSIKRAMSESGYMDIDHLKRVAIEDRPFDVASALKATEKKEIHFVLTDRETAKAIYPRPNSKDWIELVTASSTLPFITKGTHSVQGKEYFDGGWSDPIPVRYAHEKGADEIVVIRTSPKDLRLAQSWPDYLGSWYFRNNIPLRDCFMQAHEIYNESIDFMEKESAHTPITQIAPNQALKSGTYSYSEDSIHQDYGHGLDMGLRYIMNLKTVENKVS